MKKKKSNQLSNFSKFVNERQKSIDNIGGKLKQSSLTQDSFANIVARLGIQTENLSSKGYYNLGPYITRNRLELEAAYRDNWLVGKIVDCIAEDMTKEGISLYSVMEPQKVFKLEKAMGEYNIWGSLCSAVKWARLYGGSLAVMMIKGVDYETPFEEGAVGKNTFRGLAVLDRWMVGPVVGQVVKEVGKDMGMPEYYEVLSGVGSFPSSRIHHSRVLRFDGIELPYYQKLFENLWGLSVVERMLDRLMAYDSATLGAAQLMYRAYLRTIGIKGFREALAMGGATEAAVIKQFEYIRAMQNNEGLTILDSEDTFNTHTYSFSGIADLLAQLGQQLSGAEGIPLVRLFGQSPLGFSTGDTDVRNYYDEINRRQESDLRPILNKLLKVMSYSLFGEDLPDDFDFDFNPLWQESSGERAQIASANTNTIISAFQGGLINKKQALQELLEQSHDTGVFTNISQEDLNKAEEEPPPGSEVMLPGGEAGSPGSEAIMPGSENLGEEKKEGEEGEGKDKENKEISLRDKLSRYLDRRKKGRLRKFTKEGIVEIPSDVLEEAKGLPVSRTPSQSPMPVFALCQPVYVDTKIANNVWMKELSEEDRKIDKEKFMGQWYNLYNLLSVQSIVYLIPPKKGLADQTYVNCAAYLPHVKDKDVIILSNFTAEGREGEEVIAGEFFSSLGYKCVKSPFKFEGDAELKYLRDDIYFGGYGIRSDIRTYEWIMEKYGGNIISIHNQDDYLYHLDCILLVLNEDNVMLCVENIEKSTLKKIEKVANVYDVSYDDCLDCVCNSVLVGQVLINSSSLEFMSKRDKNYEREWKKNQRLEKICSEIGYDVMYVNMSEAAKSGAALSCFVMHLNYRY